MARRLSRVLRITNGGTLDGAVLFFAIRRRLAKSVSRGGWTATAYDDRRNNVGRMPEDERIGCRLTGEEHSTIGRGNAQHEDSVAHAPAEPLTLVDPVDEYPPHDDHRCRECRHRNDKPKRTKQSAHHQ